MGISFLDPARGLLAAQEVGPRKLSAATRILIECPVMYESIRPFLESLKPTNPHRLPISKYLIAAEQASEVALPEYSIKPGFKWDLRSLLDEKAGLSELLMSPGVDESVVRARTLLKRHGKLDAR